MQQDNQEIWKSLVMTIYLIKFWIATWKPTIFSATQIDF